MALSSTRARIATLAAVVLFIAGTVAAVVFAGLELSTDWLFVWLMLGLLALSLTDIKRWARGVIFDWLPFAGFLLAYDIARGVADNTGIAAHTSTGIDFDRALFGHTLPSNFLQTHLFDIDVAHWSAYVPSFVSSSHFFVPRSFPPFLWPFGY